MSSREDVSKKYFPRDPHINSFIHICIKRYIESFVFFPVNVRERKNTERTTGIDRLQS